MECKVIREKLSAFLEGAVSPEERRLIGEHLPACQLCTTALEDLRKTEALLKGFEKVEPPAWFKQKVIARIRAEQEAKKSIIEKLFYPLNVKIPIEAFATVLIAMVAIYIFKAVAPEMKPVPSLSPGAVSLAPGEKAIPEKDLSPSEKGDPARYVKEKEKDAREEKKSVVGLAREGESKVEASKPLSPESPLQSMLAKKEVEAPKQPAGPAALAPAKKAVREKDLSPTDMGDLPLSVEEREKGATEEKKTAGAVVKERESEAETDKPLPGELPSALMRAPPASPVAQLAPKARATSPGRPTIDQARRGDAVSPKARVAVSRFEDKSAKGKSTGQIGEGMAEMLANALFASNQFIVMERQSLGNVLQEQDLGTSGRVKMETSARIGEIEGADLLIRGTITEFEPGTADARGALGGRAVSGISAGVRTSHVALIIKVIDAKTGRILASERVEGKATDIGSVAGLGGGGLAGAFAAYSKTPMEKAIKVATEEAVKVIIAKTPPEYFREFLTPEPRSVPNDIRNSSK